MSYQPQLTASAKERLDRLCPGFAEALATTDPEFVERLGNFAFDQVPTDADLPERTRLMIWLATCLGSQAIDLYAELVGAALGAGVTPVEVKEIVYQASAYLGMGRVYPFLAATNAALEAAGVDLPLEPQATTEPTLESRLAGGEMAQVACLGEQMHGYKDAGNPDYPHINWWLVSHCFGDWYTRGGLTPAEREMITFCFIAAQGGCENQLRGHTNGNLHCGNDRAFLVKVVSTMCPFIGYPRTLNALAIVEEITGT